MALRCGQAAPYSVRLRAGSVLPPGNTCKSWGSIAVRGSATAATSGLDARSFWHEGLLGQAHYVNDDYEQALDWARSALSRNELIRFNHRLLIVTLDALGRRREAAEAARRFLQIQPDFHVSSYTRRCPFRGAALETWLGHLRSAGLPD